LTGRIEEAECVWLITDPTRLSISAEKKKTLQGDVIVDMSDVRNIEGYRDRVSGR
jgi:hypothetical protein